MEGSFNSEQWLAWERRCVERARGGDRAAFAELYRAFAGPLYSRVLMPRLGNAQAAEDALSETFRTLLERLERYQDQGRSIWSWLARIAINKATDMHRVKGRTARALTNYQGLLAPLRPADDNPGAPAEDRQEMARLQESVANVLKNINPRYKRAIELRFLQDRPRHQCAELMDVRVGTFDVLILRALRAFRREWEILVGSAPETV